MASRQQLKQIQIALINAVPSKSLLERLLYYELNKNLNEITSDSNLQTVVFQLMQTAEAQGWLIELVMAARKENPGNSELVAIADELLLSEHLRFNLVDPAKKNNSTKTDNPIKDVSQQIPQSNFEPFTLWSFHHCSLLLEKLLNDRQREEWIGDLEEVLYKIHDKKQPKWRLHMETLRRTFDLLNSLFIIKVNPSSSKRKRPNL